MNADKMLKVFIPAAAVFLLCGCPAETPHVGNSQYLAQPERVTVEGTYIHPESKIVMPQSVDLFQRGVITRYDTSGLDISAGYHLITPSHHTIATVYVYPAPSLTSIGSPADVVAGARAHLAEREFERRKYEIEKVHPGATLIEQHDTTHIEGGHSYPGKVAIYEYEDQFGGSRTTLRSQLYVFCFVGEKWAVEYRFTSPKNEDSDKEAQTFFDSWNWY